MNVPTTMLPYRPQFYLDRGYSPTMTEREIDVYEEARADHLRFLRTLPRTEAGWRRLIDTPDALAELAEALRNGEVTDEHYARARKMFTEPARADRTDPDEIAARVDPRQLLERYGVRFREVRGNLVAKCPLPDHDDERPSWSMSVEKKVYNCFGCGASGNVFGFVMAMEGCDFRTAKQMLL